MNQDEQIAGRRRRHVVLVAYYFPPMGGSGVQRVAKWAKYLPENGWDVTVLTVEPGAYFAFDDSLLGELENAGVRTIRTRSLDPTRAIGAKKTVGMPSERTRKLFSWVTGLFFLPDNKRGWLKHARKAYKDIEKSNPVDAVLSSAPPYTSLMVGDELALRLGVPHVVDYRDDWVSNPRHRYPTMIHKRWHAHAERDILSRAARVLTINDSIASLLRGRHPDADIRVVPQGYDPSDFNEDCIPEEDGRIRLVYSGMFYDAQQPDSLLQAVSLLLKRDSDLVNRIELLFVGLFPDEKKALVAELGLEQVVTFKGYVSHSEAVADLQRADILWMIVGNQEGGYMISTGKLFEYMGSRRPILALVPEGEVRTALSGYGAAWTVDPDDVGAIATMLASLFEKVAEKTLPVGDREWVEHYNRRTQTAELATLLEETSTV